VIFYQKKRSFVKSSSRLLFVLTTGTRIHNLKYMNFFGDERTRLWMQFR